MDLAFRNLLEEIADMKFSETTNARMQHLMDLNNNGELSERERAELTLYA